MKTQKVSYDLKDMILDATGLTSPMVEQAFYLITAGRAAELMRAEVRRQLTELQEQIGFSYIRFHGLFHEELFICRRDASGELYYTWHYLDELFDYLLSIGLRPFLELGFMPEALASGTDTCFWWEANITPPEKVEEWEQLVRTLVLHLIERYGQEEVRSWYFEVWNEPNLGGIFWTGGMQSYFELFESTYRVIKAIDPLFRVGGPATSNFTKEGSAPWFPEFDEFCREKSLVPDFYSCHPYPNNWAVDTDGRTLQLYRERGSLLADCQWLDEFLINSANPKAEIHLTEWNSSPSPRDLVHDTAFMGPFILENLKALPPSITSVGYWAFTDIFEENGIPKELFHGGFGLLTIDGRKKASWYAYRLLSEFKGKEVTVDRSSLLSVDRKAQRFELLVWNYAHYTSRFASGDRSRLTLTDRYEVFERAEKTSLRIEGPCKIVCTRVGPDRGSAFDAWVQDDARCAEPRIEHFDLGGGETLEVAISPHELLLISGSW